MTAYITWDGYCFEDGIVLSESAARKMACPQPLEPGDKISNRHGTKGVISQVLPDGEMPKTEDGTAVELIYTISGLVSRLNFGQVREALLGRLARAEGKTAFAAPSSEELRERLRAVDLGEDGLEQLSLDGEKMAYRSTVGWVYWGCTLHLARTGLEVSTDSWVVAYRRLGFYDVSIKPFIAFHPVRDPGKVLRLHPLVCGLMDSDFDGDKGAVFLPLSVEAQAEAGERLTQK